MKKISISFFLFLSIFIVFPRYVFAAVVINEVSSATSPEWVELYNTNPDSVFLQGYTIDFGSDSQKKSFCDNDQIAGNSYRAIILAASWLNNEGDTVTLKSVSNIIDSISYGSGTSLQKPNNTQSITRSPDGSLSWILTDVPTQQGDTVTFECPTPTPTPTDPPTPTKTPTPTKIPTPTNTPMPTATKTPASTATPYKTLTPTLSKSILPTIASASAKSNILGTSVQKNPKATSEPILVKGESFSILPSPTFFVLTGLGIITSACGILLFRQWRQQKEEEI